VTEIESAVSAQDVPDRTTPLELHGRVAIVTGGAKGMGGAICSVLAEEGANVVLAGRDVEALEKHAEGLNSTYPYGEAIATRCDVTREEDTEAVAQLALNRFERIDILVNTAGVIGPIETPAQEVGVDDFRGVVEINVVGTFLACKAVLPTLIEHGSGRIVNIAGTSGLRGYRNRVSYSSSKWAVRGLTRTLALELGPHGITVNDICPNVTNGARMEKIVAEKAERLGKTYDEVYADFASQTALGRFIDEPDIAEAVRYLVSDRARNVTGQDIVVDAGWAV
jgi:NAD(P)-dependent dehydrogenase (short-subunit alcohol dehydrogenase family)